MKHDNEASASATPWHVRVGSEQVFTGSYAQATARYYREVAKHHEDLISMRPADYETEGTTMKQPSHQAAIATRYNMERLALIHPKLVAYSPVTGERRSADPGDYFWRGEHEPLMDEHKDPMVLGVPTDEVNPVFIAAEADTPFEPQFGEMSREELLVIARRYHLMLGEVEAFAPGSECDVAGGYLVIDSVDRFDSDSTYANFWGTSYDEHDMTQYAPYIIGDVL
jgi:hypothetical protein